MRTVEFRRVFDNDNALRVRFDLERSEILYFVVQLECWINDRWIPVVRHDTAHGFAPRDKCILEKKQRKLKSLYETIKKA